MRASSAPTFEELIPRTDPIARLLLLIAKVELNDAQISEARSLARQVRDWNEFTQIATNKFAVTFAQRHLQAHVSDVVPETALTEMKQLALASKISTLRVAAALLKFHQACIEKTGAKHTYLKGLPLAQQFTGRIGDRFCRDIDILVASKDFPSVLDAAVSSGYRVCIDEKDAQLRERCQDLRFLSKYADVVTLIGQDSIPIEVHRKLDKLSLNFDLKYVISTAEDVRLPGVTVKTMSRPMHLVYVCYHHSRHFWSRLHWLADLDAMLCSPTFDRGVVQNLANSIGIRPTIEAAFEFHRLISQPALWEKSVPLGTPGGQFLKACLVNLDGDLDLEQHLRKGMTLNDFMSAWQISPGRQNAFWFQSWLRRLRPSVTQYFERKYPPLLYWVYSLENAAALGKNGFVLAFSAARRSLMRLDERLSASPNSRPGEKVL